MWLDAPSSCTDSRWLWHAVALYLWLVAPQLAPEAPFASLMFERSNLATIPRRKAHIRARVIVADAN
jgi:hypothetical protein